MNRKLSGKVALVTGGSRGIGAAIARALADDGADVAIGYGSSMEKAKALVRELQDKGVRAVAFQADQAGAGQVTHLVRKVAEHFGHLDILVNGAGGGVTAAVPEASKVMGEGGRIISIGSSITVNVVQPGPIVVRPEEIGATVAFLASRGAAFITGSLSGELT